MVREALANDPVASASTPNVSRPMTAPRTPASVTQPATVARTRVGTSSAASAPVGGANPVDAAMAAR